MKTERSTRREFLFGASAFASAAVLGLTSHADAAVVEPALRTWPKRLVLSDAEWKRRLTPASYDVLRRAGTESPYTSALLDEHRRGVFACAGCALALFDSQTKFDSHTGWPSFFRARRYAVTEHRDASLPGEARTEVRCAKCDGHVGHVFNDGPPPTGLRYCMNGVALAFRPLG